MKKYIDAEKLKEEINKVRRDWLDDSTGLEVGESGAELGAAESILDSIDEIIDSLQQEHPEVDLAEEITRFFSKNPIPYEHITDWPLLKNTAIHFYELGLNARKEENK